MIVVENLVKQYGNFRAVDQLSFEVKEGEIMGFLGPNGAGKSTTMNMITGYISASEGNVWIDGHNVYDEPELAKRQIGYLPEIPPVYPDMRVKEYLYFVTELKKIPKARRKAEVEEVMEKVRVTHMQHKLIKHLSKGYRQRVGLAQALIGNPKVIILDEPTVGLDPMQITWMRQLIRNLAKDHTVILSSHILFEVNAVCDRVLIINRGKKIILDTPENVIKKLGGTEALRLLVKGTAEEATAILSAIPDIQKISVTKETDEQGLTELTVYAGGEVELRETVFRAFSESTLPLYEMNTVSKSLEEVFIEMTGDKSELSEEAPVVEEEENHAGDL